MDSPEVLTLLRSIDRRLALLTGAEERAITAALTTDVLTTPARVAMWDAIDGATGNPELGRIAKVSERAAQQFTKELLDDGLVVVVPGGRGTVVRKDDDGIVRWYLSRNATSAG